jgi:methylase of polypeptide subunit release factors
MMEFGDGQAKAILSLFDANLQVDILKDLSGRERYLTARRI